MFGPKRVIVELSDEARTLIREIDADVDVLVDLMHELLDKVHRVTRDLEQAPTAIIAEGELGAQAFVEDPLKVGRSSSPTVELPEEMVDAGLQPGELDEERRRATPFTRAPRSVQVEWLRSVLADGEWHTAIEIARSYATDERHFRYMRNAVGTRMRELWEEDQLERRDSAVKGSMFEYRLKKEGR